MSRYTEKYEDKEISWGYDEPMQEYFIMALTEDEDGEEVVEYWVGSHVTIEPHPDWPDKATYSNGDFLELIENNTELKETIPAAHKDAIAMDLKF